MPLNRARIIEYLRQGEGAPPPVFVGRGDILEDILTTAKESAGQPKMTRIVQGAPGAGKSSLIHKMQQQWTGQEGTPRVVTVSSASVSHDTSGVIQAIVAAGTCSQDGWRRILRKRLKKLKSVGASVAGYGLSAEFDAYREATLLSGAIRQGEERTWKTPIVVAVDEAQALQGDPHSVAACFLREIHNADTPLPLILVLTGLSDTATRSREMNLTRDTLVHETKPLTAAQTRDFMRRLALYFGLDTSRHNARLNDLADLCDGWPRHLRHAGESLGNAALNVNGDMNRMDWTDIGNDTWSRRQTYYGKQYSPDMRRAPSLIAAVMRDIPVHETQQSQTGLSRVDVLVSIARHRRTGESPEDIPWNLPENTSLDGFLRHLTHQGALYEDAEGYVHSPIPSFRSYLIERGTEPEPRLTADREDVPDAHTVPNP